jgi:multidrug efflux pump subunit AcrA (membrane-fusion protein)
MESAQAVLDASRVNANQDLERLRGNVETAEISTNLEPQLIAIERLERQLEDATITSPVFGTVTAIFAREGAAGTGLLFVIEDVDNLKITTRIREFDVGRVRPGMSVTIRADSIGDAVYTGELSMIEPAALKNAAGETNTATDIEFGAEIQVMEQSDLLIGMETRLTIEIEKRENVFMLPYDAIELYEDGTGAIYVAEEVRPNQYIARRMEVETGLETDFFVEIMGYGLVEGMRILNDADQITEGMSLALS